MFRWQRHLHSIFRIGSNLKHTYENGSSFSIAHASAYPFYGLYNAQQRVLNASFEAITQPYFSYIQHLGISNSTKLLKESSDSSLSPVSSPLIPVSVSATDQTDNQTVITKPSKVQAVLKGIRQSSKKVNLVAALVRGMRVEDSLLQLQLTVKRAAKTVYQVIHSARANAVHNHGLDPDRLLVAEAFVGKGTCLKRVSYHARGRSGVMVRPYCRLTVVVRETTPEEEAEIARLRVSKFRKLTKREHRLVPHKLIETTPRWGRKTIKSARTEIDA